MAENKKGGFHALEKRIHEMEETDRSSTPKTTAPEQERAAPRKERAEERPQAPRK